MKTTPIASRVLETLAQALAPAMKVAPPAYATADIVAAEYAAAQALIPAPPQFKDPCSEPGSVSPALAPACASLQLAKAQADVAMRTANSNAENKLLVARYAWELARTTYTFSETTAASARDQKVQAATSAWKAEVDKTQPSGAASMLLWLNLQKASLAAAGEYDSLIAMASMPLAQAAGTFLAAYTDYEMAVSQNALLQLQGTNSAYIDFCTSLEASQT